MANQVGCQSVIQTMLDVLSSMSYSGSEQMIESTLAELNELSMALDQLGFDVDPGNQIQDPKTMFVTVFGFLLNRVVMDLYRGGEGGNGDNRVHDAMQLVG